MLALTPSANIDPRDDDSWKLTASSTRENCQWEIKVYLPRQGHILLPRCLVSRSEALVRVRYTAREFADLAAIWTNGAKGEQKSKIVSSSMVQCAHRMWGKGTPEHVAMVTLGPWALTQYFCKKHTKTSLNCLNLLQCMDSPDYCVLTPLGADGNEKVTPVKKETGCQAGGNEGEDKNKSTDPQFPEGLHGDGTVSEKPKEEKPAEKPKEEKPKETPAKPDTKPNVGTPVYHVEYKAKTVENGTSTEESDDAKSDNSANNSKCCSMSSDGTESSTTSDAKDDSPRKDDAPPPLTRTKTVTWKTGLGLNEGLWAQAPSEWDDESCQPLQERDIPESLKEPTSRNSFDDVQPVPGWTESSTAVDAELRTSREGCIVNKDGCLCVLGIDNDPAADATIRGTIVMPVPQQPIIFADSQANVDLAIEKRITENELPFTATKADIAKIARVVKTACYGFPEQAIFGHEKVEAWAEANLCDIEGLKSKKWSSRRFWSCIEGLHEKVDVEYLHKASIKAECMPKGKAPRMLIADGDDGTLMALIAIKCFEDLLFHHMEKRSIKHKSKKDAMKDVVKDFNIKGGTIIEGDGRAWDTCCSSKLRDIIENPIVEHITAILIRCCVVPQSWLEAHVDSMSNSSLKLWLKRGSAAKGRTRTINSIRRSGHRGTSCLNYWINHTLWYCCLYNKPEKFLNVEATTAKDVWGETRKTASKFEGDDSVLQSHPQVKKREKDIDAFWTRHGFHMKLKYAEERATFTGWNFQVREGSLTGMRAPDLARAMKNAGVSTSAAAIQAAKDGNKGTLQKLAGSVALSRAYDFAGIFPTLSSKYLEYSEGVGVDYTDHELQMRIGAEVEPRTITTEIQQLNLRNCGGELGIMKALGYETSQAELLRFQMYPWDFDNLSNFDGFKQSIPKSWLEG